jgi:hypothetical protein
MEKLMQEHIRPVPPPGVEGEQGGEQGVPARPRASLPRTSRPLPTDRLRFETQIEVLKALAITSDFGKRSVSGEELAAPLSLAPTTAGLNNAFFVDAALATKEGRGQYKPTAITNEFARKHSFDPRAAGIVLAQVLRETWFYTAVGQRLALRPATKAQVIEALAHAVGATKDRQVQLVNLLDWLGYAGLIDARGEQIVLTTANDEQVETPSSTPDLDPPREPASGPGDTAAAGTTTDARRAARHATGEPPPNAVLSMSVDFALTADDLARLDADQIRALFQSVGEIMAIKATMT